MEDGFIRITNSSASSRITFQQEIESNHVGEVVTVAVCDNAGVIHRASATVPAVASTETFFCLTNFNGHTARLSLTAAGKLHFQIIVNTASAVELRWAGLFKGNQSADVLSSFVPEGYGVELVNCIGGTSRNFTVTLPLSGWNDSAPYTQTVDVPGIYSTNVPLYDVNLADVENRADTEEAFYCITSITAFNGGITVVCDEDKPAVDVPIIMTVVY